MSHLLDQITKENDIKNIHPKDYKGLAKEIRRTLVRGVSNTGGHLASNLGTVELTIALHLMLHFPEDKLVWDVGHQSYAHKLLTGRTEVFDTLRSFGGISGFPKTAENQSDTFETGHSSTSISVALGLAKARDLKKENHKVVAVIGDGALSGGMAFEALNNATTLGSNMVIILNDNTMSISPNVGGMSNYLGKIRTNKKYNSLKNDVERALEKMPNMGRTISEKIKRSKDSIKRLFIPGMLFEDMGLTYIGPVNGHNLDELRVALESAMIPDEPVIIHVITKKGKGYLPAEENPSMYHGVEPFSLQTGEHWEEKAGASYTSIFGEWMCQQGKINPDLVAVCAAMPDGTGLSKFASQFTSRFFDVGIAEEHAVTFAAGLAAGGMKPVVAVYSTFLQRAYDQILHDVCIGNRPVIFAIDRSGIVGKDGETHQGLYDISFLSSMPNMTILSPMDGEELYKAFDFAVELDGPVAIRYPRGVAYQGAEIEHKEFEFGKAEVLKEGTDVMLVGVGSMVETAIEVSDQLKKVGISSTIINTRFVKPFDEELLLAKGERHQLVVILEENTKIGSLGQQVEAFYHGSSKRRVKSMSVTFPDQFIEHGMPEELKEKYGLDAQSIVKQIKERL